MPLRCQVASLESLALSRVGQVVTKVKRNRYLYLWVLLGTHVYFLVSVCRLGDLWFLPLGSFSVLCALGQVAKAASEWAGASEGLSLGGQPAPQVRLAQPGSDIDGPPLHLQVLACVDRLGHLLLGSTPCIFHPHIASATLAALSALIGDKSSKTQSRWDP